jgi:hypothetical protein
MPQHNGKVKRTSAQPAPRFNNAEFVKYELSKEEKSTLKTDYAPRAELAHILLGFCEGGYKVTVKFDAYSSCYACFVQRADDKPKNANLILTGRGSVPASAILEAAFKHWVLFDEDWPVPVSRAQIEAWDAE